MTAGRAVPRWGIVTALVLAAVVGTILVLRGWDDGAPRLVRDVRPAAAPFTGLTAGRIRVGDRSLAVVVVDSPAERTQGLRGLADPAPYDGMLFVFGSEVVGTFTMAGVPAALDLVLYAADGRPVARRAMAPCAGTDATCPTYSSDRPFRYALETAAGGAPAGRLVVGRRSAAGARAIRVTPAP